MTLLRSCCGRPTCVSVLFSEPKIPQWRGRRGRRGGRDVSVLFSEPKIPQSCGTTLLRSCCGVSVLFSEPKIPQSGFDVWPVAGSVYVSVLFSEPKIPQLQLVQEYRADPSPFQCSSASRKFLNLGAAAAGVEIAAVSVLFSEPKIPQSIPPSQSTTQRSAFQCSSASRKFLNTVWRAAPSRRRRRFSALQRAENSSIERAREAAALASLVSVLFSEPKIPQCGCCGGLRGVLTVSVLFSEPKIPQFRPSHLRPSIFPTAMITLRHS